MVKGFASVSLLLGARVGAPPSLRSLFLDSIAAASDQNFPVAPLVSMEKDGQVVLTAYIPRERIKSSGALFLSLEVCKAGEWMPCTHGRPELLSLASVDAQRWDSRLDLI